MVHIKAIRALLGLLDLCKVCSVVAKEVIQVGYIKPLGRYTLKLSSLDGLIPQFHLLVNHIHRGCTSTYSSGLSHNYIMFILSGPQLQNMFQNKRGVPIRAQTQIEVFTPLLTVACR